MIAGHVKALFVALSLALDVFAVSIGVGMREMTRREKIIVGTAFVVAEQVMNLIGVVFGHFIGEAVGSIAAYLGFGALVAVGAYMIYESAGGEHGEPLDLSSGFGLTIAALSISLDSLGIGFSLNYIGVPIVESLLLIAAGSVVAVILGISLGKRLGERAEGAAGRWAGIVLVLTGLAFAGLKLTGHG